MDKMVCKWQNCNSISDSLAPREQVCNPQTDFQVGILALYDVLLSPYTLHAGNCKFSTVWRMASY